MQLCERFGYDRDQVAQQLRLVGLTRADHRLVEGLHRDVIGPHAKVVVGRFYQQLKRDKRFWEVMGRGFSLPRLHRAQVGSLRSLGRDFDTLGYFERRLRIGVVHARAQVPLELYLGAYRILTQELLDRVPQASGDYPALILKLMMLDMSVVAQTYHLADLEELQHLLVQSRSDADQQRHRAQRDSLTSLFNRDHAFEVLGTTFEAARHGSGPMAVAMLDLDRFKPVNDRHGHAVGDAVLREAVGRMRQAIRDTDTLGRYGGDEFLLVLEGVDPPEAHEIVERLRARVASDPFEVEGQLLPVTVSAGLVALEDDADADALVRRADEALYRAKRGGRNRVCFATRDPRGSAPTLDRLAPLAAPEELDETGA